MEEEIKKAYFEYLLSLLPDKKEIKLDRDDKIELFIVVLGSVLIVRKIKFIGISEFKQKYLMEKDKPTIKDEVTWLRQALSIQGIEIHEKVIEVMIETYKVVKEKGNKTTFKDALDVTKEINRRNKTTVKYDIK
jgi:hypothetical protein